jgi:hypothetical protein
LENGKHATAKEVQVKLRVEFSCRGQSLSGIAVIPASKGGQSLSGIAVIPASKDLAHQLLVGEHVFRSRNFMCSQSKV